MNSPVLIVQYTVTPRMLHRAQRAIGRRQRWMRVLGPVAVAVLLASLVGMGMLRGEPLREAVRINLPWVIGFAAFVFLIVPLIQRWDAGRKYRDTPAIRAPRVCTFSPEGFSVEAGPIRADIQWSALESASETDEFVLLHTGKSRAQFIPKDAFQGATEIESLRRLVVDAIGNRADWSGKIGDAAS